MVTLEWSNPEWRGGGGGADTHAAWHIDNAIMGVLGESLSGVNVYQFNLASASGADGTITFTLTSAAHNIMPGDMISISGYQVELCNRVYAVKAVSGANISVDGSFSGQGLRQFAYSPVLRRLCVGHGHIAQAMALSGGELRFEIAHNAFAGTNGSKLADALVRMDYELLQGNFNVCHIMMGINDMLAPTLPTADYIALIGEAVAKVKAAGKKVILGAVTPILATGSTEAEAAQIVDYNSALAAFAAQENIPYLDYHSPMLASGSNFASPAKMYDRVHPNSAGYATMAKVLAAHAAKHFTVKTSLPTQGSVDNLITDAVMAGTKALAGKVSGTGPTGAGYWAQTMTGTCELVDSDISGVKKWLNHVEWTAAGQIVHPAAETWRATPSISYDVDKHLIFEMLVEISNLSNPADALTVASEGRAFIARGEAAAAWSSLPAFNLNNQPVALGNGKIYLRSLPLLLKAGEKIGSVGYTVKVSSASASGSMGLSLQQPAIWVRDVA